MARAFNAARSGVAGHAGPLGGRGHHLGTRRRCCGMLLIQQDVSTIDLEQKVEKDSEFSTIEKFFTETADAWAGIIHGYAAARAERPFATFRRKATLLVHLRAQAGLSRARLQKFADETVIHYTTARLCR